MKNRIAFTLIELVLVLAILGIILMMTLPNSEFFNSLAEKAELRELKRDILWPEIRPFWNQVYIVFIFGWKKTSIQLKKLEILEKIHL